MPDSKDRSLHFNFYKHFQCHCEKVPKLLKETGIRAEVILIVSSKRIILPKKRELFSQHASETICQTETSTGNSRPKILKTAVAHSEVRKIFFGLPVPAEKSIFPFVACLLFY